MNRRPSRKSKSKNRISNLTVGKVQLRPILDVLRFDRVLMENPSLATLVHLIQEHKDFADLVDNVLHWGARGEKLIEATRQEGSTWSQAGSHFNLRPFELRAVLFHLFSSNQRGGGSQLSANPLIELDAQKYRGLEASWCAEKDILCTAFDEPDSAETQSTVRLSGYHIGIGQPYARKLVEVTSLLADTIDRVSANLSVEVSRRQTLEDKVNVEDLSVWCKEHLRKLMAVPASGGRFIAKADFFLYPPPALREEVLKKGALDRKLAGELRRRLQRGEFLLSIFDISGGGAGVGLSELVARHWGFQSSGNLNTYVEQLLRGYRCTNRQPPTQVVIMPSALDFREFGPVEYLPLARAFQDRGIRSHIVTSEAYQEKLSAGPEERLLINSVDGDEVVIGREERTLIVRRYTYLCEESEPLHAAILRHPPGTTVLPSDESRIVASDCRVKLPILDHIASSQRSRPKEQGASFKVIPYLFLKLGDSNAAYAAQGFLASCQDDFPEVLYLGGVVKPVDKVMRADDESVRPAYPLPPIPTSKHVIAGLVEPLFENLLKQSVREVVVMPNILPLVVDGNNQAMPKFEIRMISLGR